VEKKLDKKSIKTHFSSFTKEVERECMELEKLVSRFYIEKFGTKIFYPASEKKNIFES